MAIDDKKLDELWDLSKRDDFFDLIVPSTVRELIGELRKTKEQPVDCREAFETWLGTARNEEGFYPDSTDRLMWHACKFGFEHASAPERKSGIVARAIEIDFEKGAVLFDVPDGSKWNLGKYRITPATEEQGRRG